MRKENQKLPAYDLSLIGALESDHCQIVELFEKALDTAKKGEYTSLQLSLVEFATALTDHIQVEDERLYGYLKILASKKSPLEQKIVTDFAAEMKDISISIFSFFSQSTNIPVTKDNVDNFITEFEQIGVILNQRISREEKILYPIYQNSRKVVNITS